jgi:hypothetical protein
VPLRVHGHYSRAETEAAFGVLTDEAPWIRREGVLWHDLALGPSLFHWERPEHHRRRLPHRTVRVSGVCALRRPRG